jgi:hypothetical protein
MGMMQVRIKNISALAPGLNTDEQWHTWAENPTFANGEVTVPKLDFIPMMQRRRLSKFARLCSYTLHHLTEVNTLQMVFTSRFGDLVKTDALIENVVDNQPLSPAQFGLSVHNAAAGQYSIFTNNKCPSTTICADVDSFHMGMVEAVARLEQSNDDELVLVCTEAIAPQRYAPFIAEQQIDHSVAILLSKIQGRELTLTLNTVDLPQTQNSPLPQALQFMAWYHSGNLTSTVCSPTRQWHWQNV